MDFLFVFVNNFVSLPRRFKRKEGTESPFLLSMANKEQLTKLVETRLSGTEMFLVEVKLSPGKLVVLIDKPAGITISECIALNRFITEELETSGFLETHELEVSSPGMEQPLRVFKQYLRRIGNQVRVTTTDGLQHEGKLVTAMPEAIELSKTTIAKLNKKKETINELIRLPFDSIKETKLILTFKN